MKKTTLTKLVAVLGLAVIASPAMAGTGFHFDYLHLDFSYTAHAVPIGDVVGEITVSSPDILQVDKRDLGADGVFSSDDVIVDTSRIIGPQDMGLEFSADVKKLGANNYQIVGTVKGTDVNQASNSHEGEFSSTNVNYSSQGGPSGALFSFSGLLNTLLPNDAILINRQVGPDEWVFVGEEAFDTPDEDGTAGEITLASGRELFDVGGIALFELGIDSVADLDEFFSENRQHAGGDLKLNVTVPVPAAMVMGVVGLGLIATLRRRLFA